MRLPLVLAALLLAGCTGSSNPDDDRDGDGLRDALETTPRAITVAGPEGPLTREVDSDPGLVDTDGDGLTDLDEFVRQTDPRAVDTDGDGLLDGHDVEAPATSARADELRRLGIHESPPGTFWGELDQCPAYDGLKPAAWSSDRPLPDLLGDLEETLGWNVTVRGQTRHVASDPCTTDADRDGLPDDREKARRTDPSLPDTDGDGARDGQDADPLWNLTLRLENVTARRADGGAVRLTVTVGALQRSLVLEGPADLELDVADHGPLDSLPLQVVLSASDPATDAPVRVFDDPRGGAILTLDLVRDPGATLSFEGPDGTLSLAWRAARV
ncbi:MAG TPA: hypothetical protein VNX21_01530 [Candidatus Thermoplasmatota archaeon]|nr:hypothetical protein [Candidatus Thermoplasmatota archaeon]